jgi:hypothetical protein
MTRLAAVAFLLVLLIVPGAARAGQPDALAPAYDVALDGSQGGFRWTGRITLTLSNPDVGPLSRVWVRLWGNGPGGCRRRAVTVTAVTGAVAGEPTVRCTALPLDLALPLPPGGRGSVSLDVRIRAPQRGDRFGVGGRGFALFSNALPVLAHREGGQWRLDRFFPFGEAWTYPIADWRVRLDAPAGVRVAAPGVAGEGGTRVLTRGRDYAWAAGRLRRVGGSVDGVAVGVWGGRATPRTQLRAVLRVVRRRLPRLAGLFGPYGWPDLQVVVTDNADMEHTGLIMTKPIDLVITHELAHEWWYALFGNDQATEPWLDEGFATWAEEAARGTVPRCPRSPLLGRLTTRGVDAFRTRPDNYVAVYIGGACLLRRLERRIGRPAFRAALREYATGLRYGWHTEAGFMAAMDAATAPGRLDDLWREFRLR